MRRVKPHLAHDARNHAVGVCLVAGAGDAGELAEGIAGTVQALWRGWRDKRVDCQLSNKRKCSANRRNASGRRDAKRACDGRCRIPRHNSNNDQQYRTQPFPAVSAPRHRDSVDNLSGFRPDLSPENSRNDMAAYRYFDGAVNVSTKHFRDGLASLNRRAISVRCQRVRLGDKCYRIHLDTSSIFAPQ